MKYSVLDCIVLILLLYGRFPVVMWLYFLWHSKLSYNQAPPSRTPNPYRKENPLIDSLMVTMASSPMMTTVELPRMAAQGFQ